MYQRTLDLNEVYPLIEVVQFVSFEERLSGLADLCFSKEFEHPSILNRTLQKQRELDDLGIKISEVDISKVPDDYKYSSLHLKVYHSKEDDITMMFHHQTGPFCLIKTDKSFLEFAGPNQEIVERYIKKVLASLQKIKSE